MEFNKDKMTSTHEHLISILEAHSNGRTIQVNTGRGWVDCWGAVVMIDSNKWYRVKPREKLKGWVRRGDIKSGITRHYSDPDELVYMHEGGD